MGRMVYSITGGILCLLSLALHAKNSHIVDQTHQWKTTVVKTRPLSLVDNIIYHPDGSLYATLEQWFFGKLVRIGPDGKVTVLVSRINRADGLLLHNNKLYITEEVRRGRILEYDINSKRTRVLARNVRKPEGIDRFADGNIVISEDVFNGKILLLDQKNNVKVLLGKLSRPEGICVDAKQALYIAETGKNRILKYAKGRLSVVIDKVLKEPDQVECHQDGSLWITEDQRPGRVFRYKNKKLYLIARGLRAPQGIAFGKNNEVYIAEQGKRRIIKLVPVKKGIDHAE
jgi:sugar lactone lactonase YvrE